LATWGNSGHCADIPQVKAYCLDEDDRVRCAVALALGRLIAGKTVNRDVEQAIHCLGTLSRDRASSVRKQAIQALGKVRSQSVVPYLQLALQDPDLEVTSLANLIMQTYKSSASGSVNSSPKPLPENSALKQLIINN